jgi:3-polyprenyl-4-hydroxybenzoate decarboxylase
MGEWLLSGRDRLIVARREVPLEFGHLEAGSYFVPKGHLIVARQFIALRV